MEGLGLMQVEQHPAKRLRCGDDATCRCVVRIQDKREVQRDEEVQERQVNGESGRKNGGNYRGKVGEECSWDMSTRMYYAPYQCSVPEGVFGRCDLVGVFTFNTISATAPLMRSTHISEQGKIA